MEIQPHAYTWKPYCPPATIRLALKISQVLISQVGSITLLLPEWISPTPLAKIRNKTESCIICMLFFANDTQKSASQVLMAPSVCKIQLTLFQIQLSSVRVQLIRRKVQLISNLVQLFFAE